jgi:putative membrane protein
MESTKKKGDSTDNLSDHLANERTFLAWTRTGLTIFTLGCAVARFGGTYNVQPNFTNPDVELKPLLAGFILAISGILGIFYGAWRYFQTYQQINLQRPTARSAIIGPAVAILILAVSMIASLVLLFIA